MAKSSKQIQNLVLFSMFAAIVLLIGLVPSLGYIPFGPLHITIIHIPVIIGGIMLGVKAGAGLGFLFGLTSFINATFLQPNPIESPIFTPFYPNAVFESNAWSLVICFLPRILVGVLSALVFAGLSKIIKNRGINSCVASIVGSFTNTILVLAGIWVFFRVPYSAAYNMDLKGLYAAIIAIITSNGVLEAALAALICSVVCVALFRIVKKEH